MAIQAHLLDVPIELRSPRFAVERPLLELEGEDFRLVADPDRALMHIDGVGLFAIDGGDRVSVQPVDEEAERAIGAYLNSTVVSILLGQRRQFALHANAVAIAGSVILIAGHSGSGKSTTAMRLIQRGHRHLTDDLSLLLVEAGRVSLHPTDRGLRLTPTMAATLGIDLDGAEPPVPGSEKYVIPQPVAAAAQVSSLVVLSGARPEVCGVEMRRITGAAAVGAVHDQIYRGFIVRRLWPEESFLWASDVAAGLSTEVLMRPAGTWTLEAVATAVEGAAAARPGADRE